MQFTNINAFFQHDQFDIYIQNHGFLSAILGALHSKVQRYICQMLNQEMHLIDEL